MDVQRMMVVEEKRANAFADSRSTNANANATKSASRLCTRTPKPALPLLRPVVARVVESV